MGISSVHSSHVYTHQIFTYMAYSCNLAMIFVSSTYMSITCEVNVVGYVLAHMHWCWAYIPIQKEDNIRYICNVTAILVQ